MPTKSRNTSRSRSRVLKPAAHWRMSSTASGDIDIRCRPGLEPGPITTSGHWFAGWSLSSFLDNAGRGVWVPAQGRDDGGWILASPGRRSPPQHHINRTLHDRFEPLARDAGAGPDG